MKLNDLLFAVTQIRSSLRDDENPEVCWHESIDNAGSGTGNQIQQFHGPIDDCYLFFTSEGEAKIGLTPTT